MICTKCHNDGVLNEVLGKQFWYCRACKEEICAEPIADEDDQNRFPWFGPIGEQLATTIVDGADAPYSISNSVTNDKLNFDDSSVLELLNEIRRLELNQVVDDDQPRLEQLHLDIDHLMTLPFGDRLDYGRKILASYFSDEDIDNYFQETLRES